LNSIILIDRHAKTTKYKTGATNLIDCWQKSCQQNGKCDVRIDAKKLVGRHVKLAHPDLAANFSALNFAKRFQRSSRAQPS
jgi:hypothetical protein